jgi:hypothetical protein
MLHKTHDTIKADYWLHTNEDGFIYFFNKHEFVEFMYFYFYKEYDHANSVYNSNTAFGSDSLDHRKKILIYDQNFDIKNVVSFKIVPYVLSHDIIDDLKILSSKERIRKFGAYSKKHKKIFSFRKIKTLQEKKLFCRSLLDAKILKDDYSLILKNTRNGNNLLTSWEDIYHEGQNNWKTTSKVRKQWMKMLKI